MTNTPDWEKEFEEKFYLVGTDERDFDGQGTRDEVKDFIHTLLSDQRREFAERLDAHARFVAAVLDGEKPEIAYEEILKD